MEVKRGCKQSEVGFIPDDWDSAALGNHATFKTGPFGSLLHRSDYVDSGIPIVNPMQIIDGTVVPTQSMTISEAAARRLSMFRLSSGDVVIGRRGDMGRCAYVRPENDGWLCGTGSMIICCRSSLNSRYLQRVLSSPPIIAAIENASVGTTMINLNNSTLRKLQIPLPPTLAEQEAIATALSDADAWIESLEQLIAKKRQIKQGAMQELLTGKRRLPGFEVKRGYKQTEVGVIPEDWEVVALGSLTTTVASGKSGAGAGQGTYPVHGSTGIIGYTERPEYEGDSILAARVGANAGKLNLVSGKYGVTDNTIMLRLRGGYSLPFFWRQLETKRLNSLVFGSGQPLITGSQLKALSLSVPSPPEQRAIATILADMDTEIAMLETKLTKARQTKQGMMQELLTGRIRLV